MALGNLMPIGRFAQSCRLSVKALRHYDELGLLEPAFVDPQSRYRYYTREQARDAVMIGMLRSLDLPLETIRRLLQADRDEVTAVVEREAMQLEAEITQKRAALLSLRHLSSAGGLAAYEVEIRERSPLAVARLVDVTTSGSVIADTTALIERLLDAVGEGDLETKEPVFALNTFHEGRERIDVEACIEVAAPTSRADCADVELTELPGGAFASLVHTGPYETLGLAHHALIAWMQERGHTAGSTVWEFYRNDPNQVAPDALETEVAIPLDEPAD